MANNPKLNDLWSDSDGYKRQFQTDEDIKKMLQLLKLETASSMVDIGCGNGAFAVEAARQFPACRIYAFDGLESAIEQCRAHVASLPNLTTEVAWANSIPMEDRSCDRVLFRSVLHHIQEPIRVYQEIARLLKPGGLLVLQAPCNYWDQDFAEVLNGFMILMDSTHHLYYYQPERIVKELNSVGLSASEPECWRYSFPFLNQQQADLVRDHGGADRLRLKPLADGKWSVEGMWVRIVAKRSPD